MLRLDKGYIMIYIGVDPGLSGAIAVFRGNVLLDIYDTPIRLKNAETSCGFVKNEIDAAKLAEIIRPHVVRGDTMACVERVGAMPSQGVSSVFSLGDSFGAIRGVLEALEINTVYVTPPVWKHYFKITSSKEDSIRMATSLYPRAPITLKKHADRAEALLIALYCKGLKL